MGGVRTDLDGRSNLARLFAAGEAACTGVHGANRLASNSLLEGLVFGERAGIAMREASAPSPAHVEQPRILFPQISEAETRSLAWRYCGIVRDREGLETAVRRLEAIEFTESRTAHLPEYDVRSMQAVALLIAQCALAREESRGGHFRTDFPLKSTAFQKASLISRELAHVQFIEPAV